MLVTSKWPALFSTLIEVDFCSAFVWGSILGVWGACWLWNCCSQRTLDSCNVLFGFYYFCYGCKSICKYQKNITGSKQEFSPFIWELRAVSEALLRLHLSLLWHSQGSLGVRSCNLDLPGLPSVEFPISYSLPHIPEMPVTVLPRKYIVTPLLTHPHLPAFLSSTYCFPPSLLQNCDYTLGTPGVQSSPGSAWICSLCLNESLLWSEKVSWSTAFPHAEPHMCFLPLLLNMLCIKCVNSFGVWWCPLHKPVHLNRRFHNVNSLGRRVVKVFSQRHSSI